MRELSEIKIIRKRLGITQKELAKKANVSQSVIAKVERNQLNLSYEKAKRIFDTLAELEQKTSKKIMEIMTPKITGIKEGSSIMEASQKMHEQGYSQLPIIGPKGNIIGSITDKIYTKLISEGRKDLHKTPVEDVMGEPFPTVDKNVSVRAVARLLEERRAVIVKDKGSYVGIVTRDNLLKNFE